MRAELMMSARPRSASRALESHTMRAELMMNARDPGARVERLESATP